MALRFGTSGVRGLVTEMTDRECFLYARAFARHLKAEAPAAQAVSLAGDLRASTPRILAAVALGVLKEGLAVDPCGFVATPAVTLHAMARGQGSAMVTGSHIPDDRNGIKFNMPWGEVLKPDEARISANYAALAGEPDRRDDELPVFGPAGELATGAPVVLEPPGDAARAGYLDRFVRFLPGRPLDGVALVVYQHSSVSRELLVEVLERLGARVVRVGWSDRFVPVDTEAVDRPERLAAWVAEHRAFALVTTDGDGDRPLVVDERGTVVRGDVLGIVVASFLGADSVAAPVSCNSALELSGRFGHVARTRIGSPYVIAAMAEAVAAGRKAVVGYEANGGFLTATELASPLGGEPLSPLPTRDAVLPIVAALAMARREGRPLSSIVADLPPRFTRSGLRRGVPTERSLELVRRFERGGAAAVDEVFGGAFGEPRSTDFTDGARLTFASGEIVHLRPSGNAPELRCYAEADSDERAAVLCERALEAVAELLTR